VQSWIGGAVRAHGMVVVGMLFSWLGEFVFCDPFAGIGFMVDGFDVHPG
jgi:hypothetical protein